MVVRPVNQWVKLTGTALRSAPAAYPRRYAQRKLTAGNIHG